MKGWLYKTALVVTIIGAINLGLIGLFGMDVMGQMFGVVQTQPTNFGVMARVIYTIIGLGGLMSIPLLFMNFDRQLNDEHEHEHERNTVRSNF